MRTRQTIRASSFQRHVHPAAYAALVLAGGYEEAGDNGRFEVEPGQVVFHRPFEAHLNRFSIQGALVLNLRLFPRSHYPAGLASVPDPDLVAQMAETNREAAIDLLLSTASQVMPQVSDWPDLLAAKLIQSPSLRLSEWGEKNRIAPWTISRGFLRVFGISPESFRARIRTQRALRAIQATEEPLAAIAAQLDFADQSHMTRSIKQLTGVTPQAWRCAANRFKTKGQPAG
jgi:AraC-like DNA-binding protein